MYSFLSRFPLVTYNGSIATNIITKILIDDIASEKTSVFYPYVIKEGERPDIIAADYYGDSRYAWLVLLCNRIVDPYYEWPLNSDQFSKFINSKYGSIEAAQQKIEFWRNNWFTDESIISTATYDALATSQKKYWSPTYSSVNSIVNYTRKQSDEALETNRVESWTVSSTANFVVGERLAQYSGLVLTGTGFLQAIDDNRLVVNNNVGSVVAGSIVGQTSQTTTTISSINVVKYSIPVTETAYWSPVYSYDYEDDQNESRKHIRLINRDYLNRVEKDLDRLLE